MRNRAYVRRVLVLSSLCVAALASSGVASELVVEPAWAQAVSAEDSVAFTFEGCVRLPDGTPAAGTVVVSTAGGQTVTNEEGEYRLEIRVPANAKEIRVTAVTSSGGKLAASMQVAIPGVPGLVAVPQIQLAQASGCNSSWLPTFGGQPGTDGHVAALEVFDDGNGAALYAVGDFTSAGGVVTRNIAKWDGTTWSVLGGYGLSGGGGSTGLRALAVFDDGGGAALYAGGRFFSAGGTPAELIAKWDGSSWSALGTGLRSVTPYSSVRALTVYDDGGGAALIAAGSFETPGVGGPKQIAKWDGSTWSALGNGVNGFLNALAVYDDGSGASLYVGGQFVDAGVPGGANNIAEWDGSSWTTVGGGADSRVSALAVFDDGSGDALFVGGLFDTAGGVPVNRIAKWDGSSWSGLGSGIDGFINVMREFDNGNGPRLLVGGNFLTAGGVTANGIAEWDGSNWTSFGNGVTDTSASGTVNAFAVFDDGSGASLHIGGGFSAAGNVSVNNLAKWGGSNWSGLGSGLNDKVYALAVLGNGAGKRLIAGGDFTTASSREMSRIAQWNGVAWTPLGSGLNEAVRALTVFDDGNGAQLIAGGDFTLAGGVPANHIARWDGTAWASLGSGLDGQVNALAVFDEGSGGRLFVGGSFNGGSGLLAPNIARWDGSSWSALGSGVSGEVRALAVYNDGGGDRLVAGGDFWGFGTTPSRGIAEWDGLSWATVGSGLSGSVYSLVAFDDGGGERLYIGGSFTASSLTGVYNIVRLDGSNWSAVGTGLNSVVYALATHDDGTGERLIAGGVFSNVGGVPLNRIAQWNGLSWQALGGGFNNPVLALSSFEFGGGKALYAGGYFQSVLDSGDSFLGEWRCQGNTPPVLISDLCNGDGGDQLGCTDCPCSNNSAPGTIGGCLNSALAAACLFATGDPAVNLPTGATNDLRFTLTDAPPASFCILNSGDALAPTNPANPCFGQGSGTQAMPFDGLRCAVNNTRRHGGRSADANGAVGITNSPWGGEGAPPAGIAIAGAGFAAGQTRFFQVINRDDALAQCGSGLNSSQAVSVTFTAGL